MDRSALKGRRIALGVGGGIAAYKACETLRELQRSGADVRVAMTKGATEFVQPLTFRALSGHPVLTDYFDPAQEGTFGHLELSRWAELYLLAPATADLIARVHAGMANDAVTTSLIAFGGKVLIAPAMNVMMWNNALTQRNLNELLGDPRYRKVGPGVGPLADGDIGPGRLADPSEIADAAAAFLGTGPLSGRRVLLTAGPTREHLDPVRFLSNPSTGKMGLAIAHAARALGAQVTVVLGPVAEADRSGLEVIDVVTADQMRDAVMARVESADYFIATAAVSDFRPATVLPQKRKKQEGETEEPVTLVRTPDVLAEASRKVMSLPKRPVVVGFAAETERVVEHALQKLVSKNLDAIVANDVSGPGAGFASDNNSVTVLLRAGQRREISGTKRQVAEALWDVLLSEPVSQAAAK